MMRDERAVNAWLDLAGRTPETTVSIVDAARTRMAWALPYAQAFLVGLMGQSEAPFDRARVDPLLATTPSASSARADLTTAGITPTAMRGNLKLSPLLCALAIPLLPAIAEAHLILLAAALALRALRTDDDADRWYTVGLTLRKLAEPSRTQGPGYQPPFDLTTLVRLPDLLTRMIGEARDDYAVFIPVPDEVTYQENLQHLHRLLDTHLTFCLTSGHVTSRAGRRGGIRGPKGRSVEAGLAERAVPLDEADTDADAPTHWVIAEPVDQADNLDASSSDTTTQEWPDAYALMTQGFPADQPAKERRRQIAPLLAAHLAELEPDLDVSEEPSDLYARIRKVSLAALPAWRQALRGLPRPKRRWACVGLILTFILGIHPSLLKHFPLRSGPRRVPGLRLWRQAHGQINGELVQVIPPLHKPFLPTHCAPGTIHTASDWVVGPLHPELAQVLAALLLSVGASWTSEGMLQPPPGSWRVEAHLLPLMQRVAYTPGLPAPQTHHLAGLHLALMEDCAILDPAIIRLLAPSLVGRIVPAMHYTHIDHAFLVPHALRLQQRGWLWLTQRHLTPAAVTASETRVGSLRCPRTDAIRRAATLLERDVRRSARHVRSAIEAAEKINATVDKLVFTFTTRYGLRARAPIWDTQLVISAAYPYFSFMDKGEHQRSLPIGAPEQALLKDLAQTYRSAAHPMLGRPVVRALLAAAQRLESGEGPAEMRTIGHVILEKGTWQWARLDIAPVEARLARAGMTFALAAARHWARSVLVRRGAMPEDIALLLGHHGCRQEEFRPFRHTCGPRLQRVLLPLVHLLRTEDDR